MSSEIELVIRVWEIIRDNVPAPKRDYIAVDLLEAFADFGFEASDLAAIVDEDPDLTDAFEEVFQSDEDEEDSSGYDE